MEGGPEWTIQIRLLGRMGGGAEEIGEDTKLL